MTVALIGLLGSLVGAAAGVAATYAFSVQEQTTDARGDARVLHEALIAADDAIQRSLLDNRYRFYTLTTSLPFADEKRLATHLTPRQYQAVAAAEADLVLQDARSHEPRVPGYGFVEDDRVQLVCDRQDVAKARMALVAFSELPDPRARADFKQFTAECRSGRSGHHV